MPFNNLSSSTRTKNRFLIVDHQFLHTSPSNSKAKNGALNHNMTKQPPINKADWRSLHFLWDIHLYSWWNFPSHHLCLCLSNSYPRGYYQTPDALNRFPLPLRQMLQGVSIIWTPGRWPLMAPNLTWDGTKVHQDQGSIY